MKEILDIRAHEDWMQQEFGQTLGEPMSLVRPTGDSTLDEELQRKFPPMTRRIVIDTRDAMWSVLRERILAAERDYPRTTVYSSITVTRRYTRKELTQAERLRLLMTRMFEPCGEDQGTVYDDRNACRKCGFGRVQRSPLRLNLRRVPKRVDFAFTIARYEWIVSQRLADLMLRSRVANEDRLTGFRLEAIEHRGRRPPEQPWYQLIVTGSAGQTVPPTHFGIDYLQDDIEGKFVCAEHGASGLNLSSEVYLDRRSIESVDLAVTRNREGILSGVLMPSPILIISPRFYRLLRASDIRGYRVEVAHLK